MSVLENVDGSAYLVIANSEHMNKFILSIDKRDTEGEMMPNILYETSPEQNLKRMLKWMRIGFDGVSCANFVNQPAIDKMLQKANVELNEYFYKTGRNCCYECFGEPVIPGIYRVCYKAKPADAAKEPVTDDNQKR